MNVKICLNFYWYLFSWNRGIIVGTVTPALVYDNGTHHGRYDSEIGMNNFNYSCFTTLRRKWYVTQCGRRLRTILLFVWFPLRALRRCVAVGIFISRPYHRPKMWIWALNIIDCVIIYLSPIEWYNSGLQVPFWLENSIWGYTGKPLDVGF